MISVRRLVKQFRRPKRVDGRFSGLRSLFTRQYVVTRAVDGIDFDIEPGELVGYLGPNGAGKSTTIKMLTGILVPTSGNVTVAGLVPWREREHNARRIGVVFGQRSQLWWDLPLRDSLRLIGKLYDVPSATYHANMEKFTELLGMAEFLETPVRQLSLGQRMRGDLAAAMLYEPRVLYLDEPTVGLDVVAKERMRIFIAELNRVHGTTVVLTTHDLDDVERLCHRIVLIDHGRLLYDGDVASLKARYAPHRELVVHMPNGSGVGGLLAERIPGAEPARTEDSRVWLRFDPEQVQVSDLIAAVLARYAVSDLQIVEPALESVIQGIYGDRLG